ncbi:MULTISPECIES: hypothetical protein [Bacillus]|nr:MULTISPECIES: hypothetical protein [Bacillus]
MRIVDKYSSGEVIDLDIGDLTEKERINFEEMVMDYKTVDNRIYQ